MGVPKGVDNFKGYRDSEVDSNLRLLCAVLEQIRKLKHPYPNLSVLVNDIAGRTGIHRTTLKRNAKYHKKLLDYLASQPGTSQVSDDDATRPILRAKLFDIRLELKNTRTKLSAAKVKLANLESPDSLASNAATGSEPDWYLAFSETAMLLRLVLERINSEYEVMKVDIENGEILDIAAPKGQQLVANGNRTRAFIQFHKKLLAQEGKIKEKTSEKIAIQKRPRHR